MDMPWWDLDTKPFRQFSANFNNKGHGLEGQ